MNRTAPRRHAHVWLAAAVALLGTTLSFAPANALETVSKARPVLDRIEDARLAGGLQFAQAARQELFALFAPERLDARWRDDAAPPTKCATLALAEIRKQLPSLDAETQALYRQYVDGVQPGLEPNVLLNYQTTHFYIEYNTTGTSAPPQADVNPANGVPDFVDLTAAACELSWSTEVDQLGYLAPQLTGGPNGKYLIQFQTQSSYAFTTSVSGQRTKIVLHPNFNGFPPNDDPDGDVAGALRVSVAHEFKHASQIMYDNWGEGGWVELDATWAEDIVYDNINDYYNYVAGTGSPFTEPQTALDSGGTGSYEDCNFEHHISQSLGNAVMKSFWDRRLVNPGESVLNCYATILANAGTNFNDSWGDYAAWNFACGQHAAAGYSYDEAAGYPTTPATATYTALPIATTSGTVNHLAANTRLITNNDGGIAGTPEFTFTGAAATSWSVSVLVKHLNGTITRYPMPLSGGAGTYLVSGEDWANLNWAALVIGNPTFSGAAASHSFSARAVNAIQISHAKLWDQTGNLPYTITATVTDGTATLDPTSIALVYSYTGRGDTASVAMTPTGNPNEYSAAIDARQAGSTIQYRIHAQSTNADQVDLPAQVAPPFTFRAATVFDPFETAGSWTVGDVGDNATTGQWQRVVPIGTIAAPDADFTTAPGTMCWVTQNGTVGGAAGAADVDNGKTTLMSPVYDFTGSGPYSGIIVQYRRWYSNNLGAATDDTWRVDASNDGGTNWVNVESSTVGETVWKPITVDVKTLFGTVNQLRFRFVAEDAGAGSLLEAGLDDFEIFATPQTDLAVNHGVGASRIELGPASPNPARIGTAMRLTLAAEAPVAATVRDLQGRVVRTLVPNGTVMPAGTSTLRWDGSSDRHGRVAPGVYFVRAVVGTQSLERKVIVAR